MKNFVFGVVALMAIVVFSAQDAQAHARHCKTVHCKVTCCEPVCQPVVCQPVVCCEPVCQPVCEPACCTKIRCRKTPIRMCKVHKVRCVTTCCSVVHH
jgi:hypothetical protein